jgi:hypothetical protein
MLLVLVSIAAPATPAEDQPVTVRCVGRDTPVKGRLGKIGKDGTLHVTLASGAAEQLPARRVVTVSFPRTKVRPGPVRLDLVGGDVIHGRIEREDEVGIVVAAAGFAPMSVPLERIKVLSLPAALDRLPEKPHVVAGDGQDVVFRRLKDNVDRVTGTVDSVSRTGIELETSIGVLRFGFDSLVAVAFSGTDDPEPMEGVHAVALCADGSRVTGRPVALEGGALVLDTPHGFPARIALGHLHHLYFRGGDFVFVSDLTPTRAEERSFFPGVVWKHRRDATVSGNPLTLGGTIHPKGLGVHAYCALTYALGGRYARFRSVIGIDDEVRDLPARGVVRFRVLVDGKQAWESPVIRGLEPPRHIDGLDVTGAKELTLIVDFADESHAGDRADWAMAMLELPEKKKE